MNEKNSNTQDIDMKCLECETIEIEENKQISLKEDTLTRVLAFWPSAIVSLMAISMSAYHLYVAYRGSPEWLFHRSIHIMFAMFIGFVICKGIKKDNRFVRAIDFSLAGVSVAIWGYVMIHYQRIVTHWYMVDSLSITDYVIGVALILLILELTRRTTGWALVFVSLFFMFHTLYASHFPGFLKGASTPISTFLEYMFMMSDGFYGSSIGTSASYVFLFVMLGAFLEDTGVGDYFMRLATEFTNCSRGGPAKSAIIASGLFGSISGSAVANVYATGVFTIPLMKRAGFKPHFAGACEAVASSGGAIMPPVMGSAAFLMADFVGVPYATIAKSALIPAILYYVSLWFFVDMEAQKMGMKRQPKVCAIDIPYYLRNSFLIAPIGVIIWMLIAGYSAFLAAFYAILCTILCGVIKNIHFLNPKNILKTLEKAGKQSVSIAIPLACAGLVVGSINLTGVGLRMTTLIVQLSDGSLPVALFCTMIVTIILGMGLPTPAAYLIVAIFAPSALTKLGVPLLTAHMFCFYYAAFSTITPPVAMAAYAGGVVAGAPINKTGFTAMKLGTAAYIIPWIFIYSDSLFLNAPFITITLAVVSALLGVYALSAGVQGLLMGRKINILFRSLLLVSSVVMILPGMYSDVAGFCIFTLVFLFVRNRPKIT